MLCDELAYAERCTAYFKQDNAIVHTTNAPMTELCRIFRNKFVGKNVWPPHSLDLTSYDFYLWEKLKNKVYATNPHILSELTDIQ